MAEASIYQTPAASLGKLKFCRECGEAMPPIEPFCAKCKAHQAGDFGRSRGTAAVLAFFAGMWGMHRFYLGQWWGIFYLLFFWTYIPLLVAWIETIVFLATSRERWAAKYGHLDRKPSALLMIVPITLVVAIVGILAAVALPAYQGYVEAAQQSASP